MHHQLPQGNQARPAPLWRAVVLRVAGCWLALQPMAAAAVEPVPGSAHECLEGAIAQTQHYEGTRWIETPHDEFMLAGDARVHEQRLTQDECLGFVAVGGTYVQDIDLTVHGEDGRALSRADGPSARPYTSYCGRSGDRVFVTVRVTDGQGEVSYAVLGHARQTLSALANLDSCPWIGTPRPAAVDVGPEPAARSIGEDMEQLHHELGPLGYAAGRLLAFGTLAAGQHEARALMLPAEHCYALVAVGSRGVADLDMRVFGGPHLVTEPLVADTTHRRNARVKLCVDDQARYLLDVAMFQGEGAYAVQSFELREPEPRLPPGLDAGSRIAYAETLRAIQARGLRSSIMGTAIVNPAEVLKLPLVLPGAGCYALAAVAVGETKAGALELGITDAQGSLLATDASQTRPALLYHCTPSEEHLQLAVRAREGHAPARVVLLLARDEPATVAH